MRVYCIFGFVTCFLIPLIRHATRVGLSPKEARRNFNLNYATTPISFAHGAQLYKRGGLHPNLPAIRAVGYRQVWGYLVGEYDYDEMQQRGMAATRQLAKRQLTWLRSWEDAHGFASGDPQCLDKIMALFALAQTATS